MTTKTYIYILDSKIYNYNNIKFVKIGSSNNPINRRNTLQTTIPTELEILRIYEILNYSAYVVDEFLKTINSQKPYCDDIDITNYRPYIHGGKEHYIIPKLNDLTKLFDRVCIEYKRIYDWSIFDDYECEHEENNSDNSCLVEKIIEKLKMSCKTIKLRDYQQECLDVFASEMQKNKYFQGIYYLATGLGKTYVEVCICLEHLRQYPTDNIIWITFRNDIIDGQLKTFDMFKNTFIICNHGTLNGINFNNISGKVIVVLRQSLESIELTNRIFNGIIYDECHDASKMSIKDTDIVYDGKTFELLEQIRKTQQLKYRIGFSATPLTDSQRQNQGIIRLYGKNDTVNYLYKYSLVEGVENHWLLKPIINYNILDDSSSLSELFGVFLNKKYINGKLKCRTSLLLPYEQLITKLIHEIVKILNQMIIKKGIIWLSNTYMVRYMYNRIMNEELEGIDIYFSTAQYNENDRIFRDATGNCLMLACDKFKTGFDGNNLEFGINLQLNDSGHVLIQKIGRFMRPKKQQQYAYMFQFCENKDDNTEKIIHSLVSACNGFELKMEDIQNKIAIVRGSNNHYKSNVISDNVIIFGITCDKMDIDEIKTKMMLEVNGGINENNIKSLIRRRNNNIIENSELHLYELIDSKSIILTQSQLFEYMERNNINTNIISEGISYVKFCTSLKVFNEICKIYYDSNKLPEICRTLKISNTHDYKLKCKKNKKLPPLWLITNGLYCAEGETFNIYEILNFVVSDYN